MSKVLRIMFVSFALVVLNACSGPNPYVTIGPRETYEVGRSSSKPFTLTTLNEGETHVIVTCSRGDYDMPITLGPNGTTTQRIFAGGWVLLMNTSDRVDAKLKITIDPVVSKSPKTGAQPAADSTAGG